MFVNAKYILFHESGLSMIIQSPCSKRQLRHDYLDTDVCIVGGGLAGTCSAITAARAGAKVVLIQDRPVLGGNASSEVRLWVLGATAHMGNNNRWAREGGVVNEILVENMYRNPEGNPCIVDTILLEKVYEETNITLLLNTAMYDCVKSGNDPDHIQAVTAFCSQNQVSYVVNAPVFIDASGDGILGFASGAAFVMGAETPEKYGEKFAPDQSYGKLLGHTIYFYSQNTGKPVRFVPPSFAIKDVPDVIPRYKGFDVGSTGCRLWWIEYGGRMNTVFDTETIKWELWKVVYGVWDYIKNSGNFPESENLTLQWVGMIPGKRESRRFEGDYMLSQQDIINQTHFEDCVSFGGWSLDLHPADGVYGTRKGCDQYHSKGVYEIPYRCMYSRNINNLFLAGRIVSSSHVAFGSTRVMGTCAHNAQAVGLAAAMCVRDGCLPQDYAQSSRLQTLQRQLVRTGQYLPGHVIADQPNLASQATITASSQLQFNKLPNNGVLLHLYRDQAQMLPVQTGRLPKVSVMVDAACDTTLQIQIRISSRPDNHTPDVILATKQVLLKAGKNISIEMEFDVSVNQPCYAFYCLMQNEHVQVHGSEQRLTGVLTLIHRRKQAPEQDIGVEHFEFWSPTRRPDGQNWAVDIMPTLQCFEPRMVVNGINRPVSQPNAWLADWNDPSPMLNLQWDKPKSIRQVILTFDVDYDHPMESVLWGHPESVMPFCVRAYKLIDAAGQVFHTCDDNHQPVNRIDLDKPVTTDRLQIKIEAVHGSCPASIFDVRCFS